jgi:hypothetical protein
MVKTIKAKFSHGTFTPLDPPPPELVHEGDEVLLAVSPVAPASVSGIRETAGSWKKLIDGEELKRNIYADRLVTTRQPVSF